MNKKIALAITLLTAFTASGTDKNQGLGGVWALDKGSPRPGDAPNTMEMRIKLKGSRVIIESKFSEPANGTIPLLYLGIMTTKLDLNVDGLEQENSIGPFDMQSKTTLNGAEMLTQWIATILGDQVEGRWTHRLSSDAKHLILEIKEMSTRGQHGEATLHFVRK